MKKTKYLLLSHHPRERNISPCTTVYNVFLGEKAVHPNADYIFVGLSEKEFERKLVEKTQDEEIVLLFGSGCKSLLNNNAIYAINYAKKKNLSVVIYWHEIAWQLNQYLSEQYLSRLKLKQRAKLKKLLGESHIKHWVPFSQTKHLIMYILKKSYEDVLIVNEAIDLDKYTPVIRTETSNNIKILGAGRANYGDIFYRKGTDYFCRICEKLSRINSTNYHGYWLGASEKEVSKFGVNIPENCDFLGFVDNFPSQIGNYDIFLLTSRDDTSPIVAFEALACDLPVFCFDSVGTREMIPREFVATDIEQMVNNITEYWNNKQKYPSNYFRKIAEEYSADKFLERVQNNYNFISLDKLASNRTLSQRILSRLKKSRLYNAVSSINTKT